MLAKTCPFIFYLNILLFAVIQVSGQNKKDTLRINLQTAIDTAIARYPKIKASLAEKKSVNEQVKSSRTAYLPSLQLQVR